MPDILPALAHEQFWALSPHTATEILRSLREKFPASLATAPAPTTDPSSEPVAASAAMLAATRSKTSKPYAVQRGVAIISISGPIIRSAWWGDYSAAQDSMRTSLDAALADTAVKAILFSIDSPGGIVSGTKELADYIARARQHKPCAAYADGLCASAAFWLASATGRIYAPQTAQVGSVGVLAVHADWSKFNEKMGVAYTYITGGAFKAAGNEDNPLSPQDKARLQQHITALHDIFTAVIKDNQQFPEQLAGSLADVPDMGTLLADRTLSVPTGIIPTPVPGQQLCINGAKGGDYWLVIKATDSWRVLPD